MNKVRILVVFANPPGLEQPLLDVEYREFKKALADTWPLADYSIADLPAAGAKSLAAELGRWRPHVVHFICHGDEDGRLQLYADDALTAGPLEAADLAALIAAHQGAQAAPDRIRLVVMTGCWTAAAAQLLKGHVDAALGFGADVQVDAIIKAFTYTLYTALGNGDSVEDAAKRAQTEMARSYPGDAQMLQLAVRAGLNAKALTLLARRTQEEELPLEVLLKSARSLQQKRQAREELDRRVVELDMAVERAPDKAKRDELEAAIAACEAQLTQLDAEIDQLAGQLLLDAAQDGRGAPLARKLTKAWQDTCHRIDYAPQVQTVGKLLDDLDLGGDGGAAFLLIPQHSRMYGEWLLKRIKEWSEEDRHCEYRVRHLALNRVDTGYILGELCKQFDVRTPAAPPSLPAAAAPAPAGDLVQQLATSIVKSGAGDGVVLAIELCIKLSSLTLPALWDLLNWLLANLWTAVKQQRALHHPQCRSLRIVLFVLTDLDVRSPKAAPPGLLADRVSPAFEGCVLTTIRKWRAEDVQDWLLKYSGLTYLGSDQKSLREQGAQAWQVGDGVPLPVWSQLQRNLDDELTARLEKLNNARIAPLRV